MLFEDALQEVYSKTRLTMAHDGIHLMKILNETVPPAPDVIFLDLNMPGKNGFDCLREIKQTPKLKLIPVIIFSTSAQPDTINRAYTQGANYYICKPGSFFLLKKAIEYVLSINWLEHATQPPKEKFVLQP